MIINKTQCTVDSLNSSINGPFMINIRIQTSTFKCCLRKPNINNTKSHIAKLASSFAIGQDYVSTS